MKKITSTFAMLLLLLIATNADAFDTDLTTGQPSVSSASVPLMARDDANVLWDLTHGVYLDYEPSGRYSSIINNLGYAGFTFTTTTAGVNNLDLSVFDVVVICLGSSWDSPYTDDEVAALLDFEANGGGILVMGENSNCPNENLDPLLSAFGVTSGLNMIIPHNLYFTNFISHPIFDGVSSLYFVTAGELEINLPAVVAGRSGAAEPVIGLVFDCRLVVVGDSNFIDNSHTQEFNRQFMINVMQCLAEPGTVATEETTLGGLKSWYR